MRGFAHLNRRHALWPFAREHEFIRDLHRILGVFTAVNQTEVAINGRLQKYLGSTSGFVLAKLLK